MELKTKSARETQADLECQLYDFTVREDIKHFTQSYQLVLGCGEDFHLEPCYLLDPCFSLVTPGT